VASLDVPCFRYVGKDLTVTLDVEDGTAVDNFIKCPVRQRLFRLTPEERVRQAFIWFLLEGSNRAATLAQYLRIGVEERSLDVAGFFAGGVLDERFWPNVTVAIVETKRLGEELAGHVEQLKTYMLRERCRAGMLFSGRLATWLSLDGEFAQPEWTAQPLTDLREAEERIEQACLDANTYLADCRQAFTAAGAGDFDSLVSLVSLFGWNLGLTFALSIRAKGALGAVQAFSLKVDAANLVTYRTRGVYSRHRQRLSRPEFHGLLSVVQI
jgi:hypothetical protein